MDKQEPLRQSHSLWRKNAKKLQRKRRRRLAAAKRDEELKLRQQSPTYQTQLANERALELIELDNIRQLNEIEHSKWLESEEKIEKKWKEHQLKIEEQTKKAEAERRRIQDEFDAQQKRIEQAIEEKKRLLEEQREREIDLEHRIQAFVDGVDDMPPELLVEAETNPGKAACPFFSSTASCRFGNKCIHNHKRQKIGRILQLPAFFTNICLDQNTDTEYGNDFWLEQDETDLYEQFKEFFVDVVPELERFGEIEHFVACKNWAAHLRGYVFVEYSSERHAMKAQRALHGRYYAGRMLNVEFCTVPWKSAVCGLSLRNVCRKGSNCNFLHIFKNPSDLFSIERTLRQPSSVMSSQRNQTERNNDKDDWNYNGEGNRRNWRWSESPIRETISKNSDSSKGKSSEIRHTSRRRRRSRSKSKTFDRSPNQKRRHRHKKKSKRNRSPSHRKHSKKSKSFRQSPSRRKRRHRSRSKDSSSSNKKSKTSKQSQ